MRVKASVPKQDLYSSRTAIGIFALSLLISFVAQYSIWKSIDTFPDRDMWANQAVYVLSHDPREFDYLQAYGHPGGTVIEGTIAVHALSGTPYHDAILVALSALVALAVATAATYAYLLRPKTLWWVGVGGVLSTNWLYAYATPPSAVAAALLPALCLSTLFLYERRKDTPRSSYILWGVIAGALVATRADIGGAAAVAFSVLLIRGNGWRSIILPAIVASVAFVAFDPFMWFMPITHVRDLIFKMVFHYAEYASSHLRTLDLLAISPLALLSMVLPLGYLLAGKRLRMPLSPFFLAVLYAFTALVCTVFLTSRFEAVRYFLPPIFMWEVFLPLFLLETVGMTEFTFVKTARGLHLARTVSAIVVLALILFACAYWTNADAGITRLFY